MRQLAVLLPALLVAFASLPSAALAQRQGLECVLLPVPQAREMIRDQAAAEGETFHVSGPARFRCADGTTVQADSIVSNRQRGDLQLIGNVFYEDSVKTLTADWLNYLDQQGLIFARGNVILTDRDTRSVIEGDELEYRRESEDRPESFTIVEGGRPHAIIYPRDTTAVEAPPGEPLPGEPLPAEPLPVRLVPSLFDDIAPEPEPDTADIPLDVVADRLEITGESYFVAIGQAELERGMTRGSGDEVRFNHVEELLRLIGNAHLYDEDIDLKGSRIDARMDEETLTDIVAEDEAILLAEDLTIESPFLHILFADGELNRLIAKGDTVRIPEQIITEEEAEEGEEDETNVAEGGVERSEQAQQAEPGQRPEQVQQAEEAEAVGVDAMVAEMQGAAQPIEPIDPSRRARIVARDIRMIADSVDALAPGQQLETLIAVGQAFAERIPEGELSPNVPEILSRDWMKGDTITGHFIPARAKEPAPDSIVVPEIVASNGPEDAAQDNAEDGDDPKIELERIIVSAVNGDAQAFYLRPPEEESQGEGQGEAAAEGEIAEGPDVPQQEGEGEGEEGQEEEEAAGQKGPGRPGANYLIASVITLILEASEVTVAEADGDVRGIYLDPTPATPVEPEETDRRE